MKELEKKNQKETLISMAVRETLMGYYKEGHRGNLVLIERGISLRPAPSNSRYQYQRQLREMRQHFRLEIGEVVIGEVLKNPSVFLITVNERRSPEIQTLVASIRGFLRDYLPGVEVKEEVSSFRETDDSGLFDNVSVRLRQDENLVRPDGPGRMRIAVADGPSLVWSEQYTPEMDISSLNVFEAPSEEIISSRMEMFYQSVDLPCPGDCEECTAPEEPTLPF
jgi:hypothetical protein